MSKATELARGRLGGADELVILLNQPDLEPPLVLVRWPAAPSVSSLQSSQRSPAGSQGVRDEQLGSLERGARSRSV